MKVDEIKNKESEMKKVIRVRAIGDTDQYVGYYNHLRRHGGDVFTLRPIIRKRMVDAVDAKGNVIMIEDPIAKKKIAKKEMREVIITAEQQFSPKWMEKVPVNVQENKPKHFNQVGKGRQRALDIPGMTSKVGLDQDQESDNFAEGPKESETAPQTEENVI